MPYADGRTYYDADSHIMELDDWLTAYVEPELRDRFGGLYLGAAGALAHDAVREAASARSTSATLADLEARLLDVEGLARPGRLRPHRARRALDLLGFERQLVFTTFASSQFLGSDDPEVRRAGVRALNRGIVDFCSQDERLLPVAFVPLGDPEKAAAEVAACLADGAAAVHVTHDPPRGTSHTHPDYDGVWGPLAEAGVPFVLHVGGSRLGVAKSLHDNGLPPVTDFIGGGENIRSKDYIALSHAPELFLACMAMDGVFDRFPRLHGGAIELGAGWVPPMLVEARPGHPQLPRAPSRSSAPWSCTPPRVHRAPGVVHAVPRRAGGRHHRPGRPRPAAVLLRLPAPRGHPRPARPVPHHDGRGRRGRGRSASSPATSPT